jgi:hypothetical protein
LLPSVVGVAPSDGQRCSHGRAGVVPRTACAVPTCNSRCTHRLLVLLSAGNDANGGGAATTMGGGATEGHRCCSHGRPLMLPPSNGGAASRDAANGGSDATHGATEGRRCCSDAWLTLLPWRHRLLLPAMGGGAADDGSGAARGLRWCSHQQVSVLRAAATSCCRPWSPELRGEFDDVVSVDRRCHNELQAPLPGDVSFVAVSPELQKDSYPCCKPTVVLRPTSSPTTSPVVTCFLVGGLMVDLRRPRGGAAPDAQAMRGEVAGKGRPGHVGEVRGRKLDFSGVFYRTVT